MSKNLTRKGLALGAVVALSSTLIAGSPAFAAGEVTLAPSVGSTYGAIAGENFILQATAGATISSGSFANLKYEILNASGLALDATIFQTGGTTAGDLSANTMTTAQVVRATGGTVGTSTLTLKVPATSAGSVVVNAWIDTNLNNAIDGLEFVAGTQTVNFVKAADITWTNTLTQPILGDTKLVASLSASNNINLGQVSSLVKFGFATVASGTYAEAGTTTDVTNVGVFSAGESATFVAASNTLTGSAAISPAALTYYVSQALITRTSVAIAEIGSEDLKATAAATIASFKSVTSVSSDNVRTTGATTIEVRNGATVVPVEALAYKTGTTKAAAGIPVTVTITESTATGNTDAAKFVAGGKTLADTTGAADKIEFVVNTNADGKVVFDIAVSGTVAAADAIVVKVAAQSATAVSTTYSFANATAGTLVNASVIGSSAVLKKTAGSTFDLKFAAVDNFGKGLGSGYRVKLTETAATTNVVTFADVVAGVATFSVTDKTTLVESYDAELQLYSASTGTHSISGSALTGFVPVIGTSTAPETLTLTGTAASLDLNLSALAAADTRKGDDAPTVISSGTISTLSGTVVDLVGSGTYADVTISATGAMFEANGVYALGSITVQSNATGAFGGVKLYSNKSGETVVTATAGGKTKTLTVTFDDAAAGTGTSWTVDAPASIAPGRTLTITPIATDKWGNEVADVISFKYVGPGLPITSALPTTPNSAYKVLLGAGDTGVATVTVKFSTDADSLFTGDDDVTVTKTITIGAAAVVAPTSGAKIATKNGRVYVTVNSAAGFKSWVKVGFSTKPAFTTTGSKLVSYYVGAGKRVAVRVYVRGGIVASQAVTVK